MRVRAAFSGKPLESGKHIVIVALISLVIVHLRSREIFSFPAGYIFPLKDFLVHFLGTLFLWEIQFWNFRHVYERKLYERGFSLKLVWQVLAVNLAISALFYTVFAPSVIVWVYKVPFTLYGFVIGLLLSLVFALVVNLFFLGMQVYRYWQSRSEQDALVLTETSQATNHFPDHIYLKTGNEELQLHFKDIAYFYTEQKVVFVITSAGKRLLTQYTLAELESLLNPRCFFKISRQTITHRQAIRSIRKDVNYKLLVQLEVNGKIVKEETVSRYKAAEFREWFREELPHSV